MGKVTADTKLVPRSPDRTDITCLWMQTEGDKTDLYWLYETVVIDGQTEEAEIIGKKTFSNWHELKAFMGLLNQAVNEREHRGKAS